MSRLIFLLVAVSFMALFTGCGQSGPLYLPGNPSKLERLPPAPRESEEERDKATGDDSGLS